MKNEIRTITKMRVFSYLTKQGVYPIETRIDKKNNNRTVWDYEQTAELDRLIDEFYHQKEDNRNVNNGENLVVVSFEMEKQFLSSWGISYEFSRADMRNPKNTCYLYKDTEKLRYTRQKFAELTLDKNGRRQRFYCCERSRMKDWIEERSDFQPVFTGRDRNGYHVWWILETPEFNELKDRYFAQFKK